METFLRKIGIKRVFFKEDSFSPLLFVICMILSNQISINVNSAYIFKSRQKLKHLLFTVDIKLFRINVREVEGLLSTVLISSQSRDMEFRIKRSGTLIMNRGKIVLPERVELPNVE